MGLENDLSSSSLVSCEFQKLMNKAKICTVMRFEVNLFVKYLGRNAMWLCFFITSISLSLFLLFSALSILFYKLCFLLPLFSSFMQTHHIVIHRPPLRSCGNHVTMQQKHKRRKGRRQKVACVIGISKLQTHSHEDNRRHTCRCTDRAWCMLRAHSASGL